MKIKFTANKIVSEINTEEDYYLLGFSDNGDEPDQYVIIQRAINVDVQDTESGMNTYYFEYYDQSYSGYGICKNAFIENGYILFELKENALKDIESIEIIFKQGALTTDWKEFKDLFNKIFSNK